MAIEISRREFIWAAIFAPEALLAVCEQTRVSPSHQYIPFRPKGEIVPWWRWSIIFNPKYFLESPDDYHDRLVESWRVLDAKVKFSRDISQVNLKLIRALKNQDREQATISCEVSKLDPYRKNIMSVSCKESDLHGEDLWNFTKVTWNDDKIWPPRNSIK